MFGADKRKTKPREFAWTTCREEQRNATYASSAMRGDTLKRGAQNE